MPSPAFTRRSAVIGLWVILLAPVAFANAQSSASRIFDHDPLDPIAPTDPAECRALATEWQQRIRRLQDDEARCGERIRQECRAESNGNVAREAACVSREENPAKYRGADVALWRRCEASYRAWKSAEQASQAAVARCNDQVTRSRGGIPVLPPRTSANVPNVGTPSDMPPLAPARPIQAPRANTPQRQCVPPSGQTEWHPGDEIVPGRVYDPNKAMQEYQDCLRKNAEASAPPQQPSYAGAIRPPSGGAPNTIDPLQQQLEQQALEQRNAERQQQLQNVDARQAAANQQYSNDIGGLAARANDIGARIVDSFKSPATAAAGTSVGAGSAGGNSTSDFDYSGIGGAAKVLPFKYEMPQPPPQAFYKRIQGELRWKDSAGQFSIRVGDMDRNWLSIDKCALLDVTFQLTLDTGKLNAGSTKAFPTTTITVEAKDGTADVVLPARFNQAGTPIALSVTNVTARACGAPTLSPPTSSCPDSLDAQLAIVTAKKELNERLIGLTLFHDQLSLQVANLEAELQRAKDAIAAGNEKVAWDTFILAVGVGAMLFESPAVAAALMVVSVEDSIEKLFQEPEKSLWDVAKDLRGLKKDLGETWDQIRDDLMKLILRDDPTPIDPRVGRPPAPTVGPPSPIELLKLATSALTLRDLGAAADSAAQRVRVAKAGLADVRTRMDRLKGQLQSLNALCPAPPR